MNVYGLIGKKLSHSASKDYFTNKFSLENIKNHTYELFELTDIAQFPQLLMDNPNIKGLNVTIPFKETIIEYLDDLSDEAKEIGAINTICCTNKLIGYNTDVIGLSKTLDDNMSFIANKKALIIGSGGAAKAVAYSLRRINIDYLVVSRNKVGDGYLHYTQLTKAIMTDYKIIFNCSPVGMYPYISDKPNIPYQYITKEHFCYDLIYNPLESIFLSLSKKQGATVLNGYKMLIYQAEAAWQIWH